MADKTEKSDKREKILEAALKIFTANGYHLTRLEEVTNSAGVAKGTLYLYFKSKEDLFLHCLLDGMEKTMKQAQEIIDGPGNTDERLEKLVHLQADLHAHNGPLIQQFVMGGNQFSSKSNSTCQFFERMQRWTAIYADFFKRAIENGDFSTRLTPLQMAIIFHQVFDLNLKFRLFNAPMFSPNQCLNLLLKMFKAESDNLPGE